MGISPFPRTVSGKVLIYGVASCAALALNAWFSYSGSRRVLELQVNATAMSQGLSPATQILDAPVVYE